MSDDELDRMLQYAAEWRNHPQARAGEGLACDNVVTLVNVVALVTEVRRLQARVTELEAAVRELFESEVLEDGLTHRQPFCTASAADSEPECRCYSCMMLRHHHAKQRLATVLKGEKP